MDILARFCQLICGLVMPYGFKARSSLVKMACHLFGIKQLITWANAELFLIEL